MTTTSSLKPDPSAPRAPEATPAKRHRVRTVIAWMLVVLFAILAPLTVTASWAVKTVTNTTRYVDTLHPLVHSPIVTNYVADEATNKLFEQLKVQEKIAGVLPKPASFIAGPVTAQLKAFTDQEMRKITASAWFANLWDKENRYTHSTAVELLRGQTPPPASTARKVLLNLTPVLVQAIDGLDSKGVTVFDPIKHKLQTDRLLTFKLVDQKQVKQVAWFFNLAIQLRIALLIGTPLIGIAAIFAGLNRRKTALRVSLGAIIGCLVLVIGLTIGRSAFVNAVPLNAQQFTQVLFDTLVRFLHRSLYVTIGAFTVIALILWLFGPSTWSVALRRAARRSGTTLAEGAETLRQSEAAGKALEMLERGGAFVARSLSPLRWVGIGIAAIFLLTDRTVSSVVWTLVALGLYQLALVVIARWSRKNESQASRAPSEPDDAEISA